MSHTHQFRAKRYSFVICLAVLATAAWLGRSGDAGKEPAAWLEVAPGIFRTPGFPAGYALVEGDAALLIDAPDDAAGLKARGVKKVEAVLLTHHHRDTCAAVGRFLADRVPVRAGKLSAQWLTTDNVRKYWQDSLPLRGSNTAYLVVPAGFDGIDFSLEDGKTIDWHGWSIRVVATPGHSRDHLAFIAHKASRGASAPGSVVFTGDALASRGKLWSPYTTDWDHWTDVGLRPAGESLRKLAALKPDVLLPAHGEPIKKDAVAALEQTAKAVEEVAFLKSFERFSKQRLGNPPSYAFLAKEQVASGGLKPWSQVSEHLFLTGNTYVLTSKDNAFLVIDPWGKRSADQIAKLKEDRKLGPMEVVLFSHAHFDHYDGIYELPDRDKLQVWTLDRVATPLAEPFLLRAPFLDARPVKIDRRLKDGENAAWREYRFRFVHFPGQTEFTMGVETRIDGKKCFFTADNFFHQDQFSGSGGWMGLNRSYPPLYAASAQKVLDAAPDWVLAEHGGPFEFNAEDFKRRVQWGQAAARAADALCPSGLHRRDWDPHRVRVEPLLQKAKPGETLQAALVADNPLGHAEKLTVRLEGRGLVPDQAWELPVSAGGQTRRDFSLRMPDKIAPGRHVLVLSAQEEMGPNGADGFVVVDVAE